MEYNSQLKHLALPEYGRHIQKMVEHLLTIENKEMRSQQAQAVINVMGNLFPYLRDVADFKHKLWDHLHFIANFQLDIDSPYPKPEPNIFESKPRHMPYTTYNSMKYRHYGRHSEAFLQQIASMPDETSRNHHTMNMANYMKKSYLTWNKDVVNDEQIVADIKTLSKGQLELAQTTRLVPSETIMSPAPNNSQGKKGGGQSGGRRGKKTSFR